MSDEETPILEEAIQQEAQETEAPSAQQIKSDQQAYNWAEARRERERLQRENAEMRGYLQSMANQNQRKPKEEEEDEFAGLSKDDVVTFGQAQKLAAKIAKQATQDALKQHAASTVDDRIRSKFPDFESVVNDEAIEELRRTDPDLAYSISQMSDPYVQALTAYKMMKKNAPASVTSTLEQKRAAANSAKPLSIQSAPKQSAIGNAHMFENGLTKDLKKQLWEEMQAAMKQY